MARSEQLTVVIAADETEHSVQVATAARNAFGDTAHYLVVSVGARELLLWDDRPLTWGVSYPVVPAGAGMNYPFVPVSSPAVPDADLPSITPVDLAQRNAEGVARAADLLDAEPLGDVGDPADRILSIAETHAADVIVVGAHHRTWLSRLFSSSVSDHVLRHACRPVLVVP